MFELARVTTFRPTDSESARGDYHDSYDPDFDRWPPIGLPAERRCIRHVLASPTFVAGAVTVLLGALVATRADALLQNESIHTALRHFMSLFG